MKSLFTTLFLLGTGLFATAQEYRLQGVITDPSGDALPGVSVMVRERKQGTVTNENGRYSLELPAGSYTVEYRFLAPRSIQKQIELSGDTLLNLQLSERDILLDEVLVSAIRIDASQPISYSDLSAEEIAPRNLGQDIPILMNYLPGVVTTSDAGAGVGYTGIRVRGSDATRVNVTINGIPYNDAESQGTFWVNLPDMASSVESLQLQRGVGTSTNGAGAFGASLNLLTDAVAVKPYASFQASAGSFNTYRTTLKFGSGLLGERFELSGRLSQIKSDGYIDRASSDLDSYFLQGAYVDDKTLIKALLFGGQEVTYQAWYGLEDPVLLRENPTFNLAGAIYDAEGNIVDFYDNEVDNYKQDHFQLHINRQLGNQWQGNLAFHYTRGRGFFEQYRQQDDLETYGAEPFELNGETITTTDLIRRRWLDNDFFGTTFSVQRSSEKWEFIAGGAWNRYLGDHFGEVVWARTAPDLEPGDRYYEDDSRKDDLSLYAKYNFELGSGLRAFADMQYRGVTYTANGEETGLVDDTFHFFNPKLGLSKSLGERQQLYLSYARANREPNRNDYESGNPRPEQLDDFELGWRYNGNQVQFNANAYYMRYKDQLVLTGELNDVGAPLRENVGDSYRLGLELDAIWRISDHWEWRPNLALSQNRNLDYLENRDGSLRNLGNTRISYSPDVVGGSALSYLPGEGWQFTLLSKYVSKQYLSNANVESAVLDAYFINDISLQYQWFPSSIAKRITFNLLVNNLLDERYISNGYYYSFDVPTENGGVQTVDGSGYYPQAGIHFLAGVRVEL